MIPNHAMSQNKMNSNDPCFKDPQTTLCLEKIQRSIFFLTSVGGEVSFEQSRYMNAYLAKHGIEGFYHQASPNQRESLFEYSLRKSNYSEFNKKLILAYPKGQEIEGKNLFSMVVSDKIPFTRESEMKAYVDNLNVLFPKDQNEVFQKTKELFGLPWDDPLFVQKYLERIEAVAASIDEHNKFFLKNDFQSQKAELLKIISKVKDLAAVPAQACTISTLEEYNEFKKKFGEVYENQGEDIVACMIKNGKYEITQKVIDDGRYIQKNLPLYFDQAVMIKETPETLKFTQFLLMKISNNGLKINSKKGESQRAFLQKGSLYLTQYHPAESLCEYVPHKGSTFVDLTEGLSSVLYFQAFKLMQSIMDEKDPEKNKNLIDQFLQLKNVGVDFSKANPSTGKTMLHMIAEAGDHEVLQKLHASGFDYYSLGESTPDNNGKLPIFVAIKQGGLKHLKCVDLLLKKTLSYDYQTLKKIKKSLRKMKTDEKEVKTFKQGILWNMKDDLYEAN
jgi:hypothetical protein